MSRDALRWVERVVNKNLLENLCMLRLYDIERILVIIIGFFNILIWYTDWYLSEFYLNCFTCPIYYIYFSKYYKKLILIHISKITLLIWTISLIRFNLMIAIFYYFFILCNLFTIKSFWYILNTFRYCVIFISAGYLINGSSKMIKITRKLPTWTWSAVRCPF